MKAKNLILLGLAPLVFSSCIVSRQKYDEAEQGRWMALYSRDSLANLLRGVRQDADQLRQQVGSLQTQNSSLGSEVDRLNNEMSHYQALLNSSNTQNQQLNSELSDKLQLLGEREKTIAQLQNVIDEQNARVKNILDNVKNALTGFSSDELSVREEGSKVYVAMSDKLLFQSGSATVNDLGREALGKLAGVLNRQSDIDIYIEGHTDSVPIRTAVFKDNWDLSVLRSTSVVRILTETYGVNPLQIQPSGRGEYKPVDTNTTPEGRARNRRTEIIIAPRLDKLFQLLNQD